MTDKGLIEVGNPSEMLLSGRPKNTPGNCAMCTIEGTRPIIAEVQALVSTTVFPAPRRTANGIDHNRLCLIIAVLEKRLGLKFYQNDVYTNVIGGLYVSEPASDAAIALALISSLRIKRFPMILSQLESLVFRVNAVRFQILSKESRRRLDSDLQRQ